MFCKATPSASWSASKSLETKLFKFATELGLAAIKDLGYPSKQAFVEQKLYRLKSYP